MSTSFPLDGMRVRFSGDTNVGVNLGCGVLMNVSRRAALTGEIRGHWRANKSAGSGGTDFATMLLGITASW